MGNMRSGGGGPLTVGDLREAIDGLGDDVEIMFGSTMAGNELIFYRFKWRNQPQTLLQIELNEMDPAEAKQMREGEECLGSLYTLLKSSRELTPASVDDIIDPYLGAAGRLETDRRQALAMAFRNMTMEERSDRREFILKRVAGRIP